MKQEQVYFEGVIRSESGKTMFEPDILLDPAILQQCRPAAGRGLQAARALQSLGFRVRHVGTYSVSGEGPRELWEQVFSTQVERKAHALSAGHPDVGTMEYFSHIKGAPFQVPGRLDGLIERAYPQIPPIFFESPLPPRVKYHHLHVPSDVALIFRANAVHRTGTTGRGVLVAMPDTGFFKHAFYAWHGYRYGATLAPDATKVERDEVGHGTAEAANIFANAPDVDFVGVKMGNNATLAFKTASDLHPAVMTNSWGYDIQGPTLPNFLRPLEAAVLEAVRDRGITVCFSAGNGHYGFPGQMPDVIAVGGVQAQPDVVDGEFRLVASDYASSFDSQIYPGRHVPDVCGLVGMQPKGVYIMLPVEPKDAIDQALGGGNFPDRDETAPNDGWAVISGTSAASPQVAGVCGLLKQVRPGLSPSLMKSILKASARDVRTGQSAMGQVATDGHDGATGAGLVDAYAAYRLAQAITIRPADALPPPR
jgi:hypothetical protein